MNLKQYFKEIKNKVEESYEIARGARQKGLDPVSDVEIPIATSLAEKATGLVSSLYPQVADEKIVKRILELEKKYGSLDPAVALAIAEEIAKEKFCKFKSHIEAIEAGVRIAVSYMTLGVVSSPIEGFVGLHIGKTREGKDYFVPHYSGPIRSAGGTEAAFSIVIIDHLREVFGYAKYDPTEDEVKRGVHESYIYHERITNLQYLPTEEEIDFLMRNVPVQISGDPSENKEVYNYKDLKRISTNFIRSGFCLTLNEGLAQKAPKILKRIKSLREKGFKLSDWNFLAEFVAFQYKIKENKNVGSTASAVYIKDLVAGRPVFGHPSRAGAFRLRYGRCRNTGYSTLATHPSTMRASGNFIAIGTQLKIEKPTKGCTVASCSTVDAPIVRFKDGSVKQLWNPEEAEERYHEIEEIIYLGDLLVPYGDFRNRNHSLDKPGYVEQCWLVELKAKGGESELFLNFEEAVELSQKFDVPLHPRFIYYWSQISFEDFLALLDWLCHDEIREGKLVLPYTKKDRERFARGKRALEFLGVEHLVSLENVVLDVANTKAFLYNLGLSLSDKKIESSVDEIIAKIKSLNEKDVLKIVNEFCEVEIRDKAGTFIGARMGRPEKSKLRKLVGSPHVLFPVGEEGGRLRSFQAALELGYVRAEFPAFWCSKCEKAMIYPRCRVCQSFCSRESENGRGYEEKKINIRDYFESARKLVNLRSEEVVLVKGVRGTSNADHSCENLAKGLLRAKYNLHVNKDGTIRYDMTQMPLTHFKPKEIGANVEKLRELGYEKDIYGKELESDEQILELFPHDVVLPASPESQDEKADDVLFRITRFVDDELEKLYGMKKFFNVQTKDDLAGILVACIAPHICTAIIGRVIGFSKTQALLASPYMHAAMRRDCLGYDNYVAVEENGVWKIVKIGDYIEKTKPTEKADNFGTLRKKTSNIYTIGNPGKGEVLEVTKHMPRKMLKIYLEDGRKIELTESHKLYLKGKTEKRARELKVGDKLSVSYKREIEEKDIENLFLPEIFQDRDDVMLRGVRNYLENFEHLSKYENFCFRDSFPIKFVKELLRRHNKSLNDLPTEVKIGIKRNKVSLPIRILLDEELLEVIGLYVAEGYLRENNSKKGFYQISIAGNEEIKEFVKRVFLSHFDLRASFENKDAVVFSSRIVYELFKDYLKTGERAKNKRIPSLFLNLKKKKISALLRGYYEGDGSVSLSDIRVCCDSVSEGLKHDLSFVLARFGILTKFYEYEKEPGPKVREFYIRKNREIPKFKITKITILSNFVEKFKDIGFISKKKNEILDRIRKLKPYGTKIDFDENYAYPKIVKIEEATENVSYCFNVSPEHNFFTNDILVHNCDGDECAFILLLDNLINFSKKFLPAHRGGTQDAPLVLSTCIKAGEVDDMIFDVDVSKEIPLELYEVAEKEKSPYDVKMEQIKDRLGSEKEFSGLWFSYDTENINDGPLCSSYKTLPTMQEKVNAQMELCKKIRAVDISDVARLIIERHFIRDTRGNLRKFSQQGFRCVACNEKFRRPPLVGKCTRCGGKIIFTVSEGSITKYMQAALDLAREYNVSPYLLESLELTEMYIQSIFGKDSEKQEAITKWF